MTIGASDETAREFTNEDEVSNWSGQGEEMNQAIYTDANNLAHQVNAQSRGNGALPGNPRNFQRVDPKSGDLRQDGLSQGAAAQVGVQDSLSVDLAKMIESQIIPRLMLAHLNIGDKMQVEAMHAEGKQVESKQVESTKLGPSRAELDPLIQYIPESVVALAPCLNGKINENLRADGIQTFSTAEVVKLVQILIEGTYEQALNMVEMRRADGVPLERVYLDFLAPAARHLGELWEEDRAFISDVAVGLSRLHQLVRCFGDEFISHIGPSKNGKNALIMPMPGETHTFGLVLVVEFFRKAGWDVSGSPLDADDDPLVMIADKSYDIVGFSVSAERNLTVLPEMIKEVRRVSKNRNVKILVGGQIFIQKPHLVETVGADGWAKDGHQSVELANALVESASRKYL